MCCRCHLGGEDRGRSSRSYGCCMRRSAAASTSSENWRPGPIGGSPVPLTEIEQSGGAVDAPMTPSGAVAMTRRQARVGNRLTVVTGDRVRGSLGGGSLCSAQG